MPDLSRDIPAVLLHIPILLAVADSPCYAIDLAKRLKENGHNPGIFPQPIYYAALAQLAELGLISVRDGKMHERGRKIYSITGEGRKRIAAYGQPTAA